MNNKPNFENAPGIDNDYEAKMQNEVDATSAKIQAIWEQNQAEDKEREGIREPRKRIPKSVKVETPEQNTKKLESNKKYEVENEFEDFKSYQKASEKAKKKNSYQAAKRIVAEEFESRQKQEQEQDRLSKEEAPEPEEVSGIKKESPEIKNKLIGSVKDSINKLFSEKEKNTEGVAAILPEENGIKIEKYIEPSLLEKTKKEFKKALIFFGLTGKKKDKDFEKITLVKKGDVIEAEEIEAEEIKDETTEENISTSVDAPEKTTPEVQKDEKLEAFTNQVSASLSLAIERHLKDYPEIKAYALNAFPSLVEDFKLGYEGSKTEEEKKELLNWVTSFCEDTSFFLSQMKHFKMEEVGADEDEVEEITRINTHREKGEFPKNKNEKTSEPRKNKGEFEMAQIEYDGLKDDMGMINKKIRTSAGISSLSIDDFKSEYGKKRYSELTTTQIGDKNKFNKTELPTLAEEMEKLLSKAQIIVKEDTISVTEESPETQSDPLEIRADLELINKSIMNSKSFLSLEESDFKSKFAKDRYKKFKSVQKGKGSTYGKNELSQMGEELEKYLRN
ncbi:hypothetical protein HXX01_02415 [Candidatus Nomurabacteria bacterium]|nr:hypothetical protein [Candidatus Nomurabacteria bacterium]